MAAIQPTQAQDAPVQRSFATQASEGLHWLNERAWPLGGCLLFIAALYLHQYIQVEKIPLSITSSAVITALPIMFALLVFVIVALSASILMPIMVLFQRFNAGDARLVDQLDSDLETRGPLGLCFAWFAGTLAIGLFYAFVIALLPEIDFKVWVGAFVSTLVFVGFVRWRLPVDQIPDKAPGFEFYIAAGGSALLQLLVLLQITLVVGRLFNDFGNSALVFLPVLAVEVLVLSALQIGVAALVVNRERQKDYFRLFMSSIAVLVVVLGVVPESASKIGGYALQVSGSGGRICVLLNTEQGPSEPMKILAEADGIYYARPFKSTSKELQLIRRDTVKGFDECPKPKPAQP